MKRAGRRGRGPAGTQHPREAFAGYARSARKRRAWSATNRGNLAIREEIAIAIAEAATAELAGPGGILDAGCGGGWWLEWLAAADVAPSRLHGIDLLKDRVEAARARVPGADVRLGDAASSPYNDDSFALVTFLTVLSSMGDPERAGEALREARRVAAPGGLIAIWEPHRRNPLNRATFLADHHFVRRVLGDIETRALTLLPPLARRLGPLTSVAYRPLARVPPLRTHVLVLHRVR